MKVPIIDLQGNKVRDISLSDSIFGLVPNKEAIAQYLRVYLMNQRQGTSKTKDRSEVSGGGKKPWKQKHTGRARHGSSRSPIWVGGGVAHSKVPKSWKLSLPKKIRRLAICSTLSQQLLKNKVILIADTKMESAKTKDIQKALSKIVSGRKNVLVWAARDDKLIRGVANLPNISITCVENLNAYEILNARKVIMFEGAAKFLNDKYSVSAGSKNKVTAVEKKVEKVEEKDKK
jgi:large subunit ribosomal protein L4